MTESNQPDGESGSTQLHSNWWRLQAVFFEPGKLFEEVNQRSNWLLPLLLVVVLATLSINYMVNSIGLNNLVEQQLRQNPNFQSATTEDKARIIETQGPLMGFFFRFGAVFNIIFFLIVAALFWGILLLSGKEARFKKVFSVVCHAYFALTVISTVLIVLVVTLAQDPSQIDIQNPIQSNLAMFVDKTSNPALHGVAASLDILYLWAMFLMGLGISKTTRRTSLGGALSIVFGLWLVWVVGKAALTALIF